jgi:protein-S-isoprenylcysteine O-methyltransferase Ste14
LGDVTMIPFAVAISALVAFTVSYRKGSREFVSTGRLTMAACAWLFGAYIAMTTAVMLAAFRSMWSLPLPSAGAVVVGGLLVAAGLLTYLAARVHLGSFRVTWGLHIEGLVTAGPYRFSRNPQVLGAIAILVGASVIARSLDALLLIAPYGWMCARWIRLEETMLCRHFGAIYQRYCDQVPRVL